jgi:hypothetical protein
LWLTVFTAIAFILICLMMIKLIQEKDTSMTGGQWTMLFLSPFIGVLASRIMLLFLVKPKQLNCKQALASIFIFWSAEQYSSLLKEKILISEDPAVSAINNPEGTINQPLLIN